VYTLGVMSMLLAVALVFSNVMMSDLNQAKSIDNSVMAYYAADSGLEKSLFYLRQADKDIAFIRGITRFDLLKNNSFWSTSRSTSSEQLFLKERLKNGEGVKLYFIGRAGNNPTNETKCFDLSWNRSFDKENGTPGTAKLQVTFTQLQPQQKFLSEDGQIMANYTDRSDVIQNDKQLSVFSFLDKDFNGNSIISDYVVEIKVLGQQINDEVERLLIKTYKDGDCNANSFYKNGLSSNTIISSGQYRGNVQEIIAHIPPRDPISGLFGFVLFSESDIVKE
ncbi:MAG: hypothetical protein WCL61_04080, partial [bacterium]